MSEWKEEILNNLVVVDPEQLSISTDEDFAFFYIDIGSVSEGHIDYPVFQIKYKGSPSRARKTLKLNDVLMSTVRPNLKSFAKFNRESKFNFVASTGFAILRAKQETDIDFVYHNLFSEKVERQIQTLVVGSNYPAINSSDVRKLIFDVPDYQTQRKIARILSTADAVIEKTQAAIAKYKAIKQGLLHDLFTRGLISKKVKVNSASQPLTKEGRREKIIWKLRPKHQDAPHLYKKSKLGWIPKKWGVLSVSDVSENLDGKRIPVKQEDRDKQEEIYPYYGASGIIDYVEDYIFNEPLILLGEDGENVVSRNLPLAFKVEGKYWVNNHAHVLKPIKKISTIDFLCESLEFVDYSTIVSGSAQPKITQGHLSKIILRMPQINEQEHIGYRFRAINEKIQTEQNYLHKLQQIKAGLMGDLLNGKVKVKSEKV